jgi:hypothetical protein
MILCWTGYPLLFHIRGRRAKDFCSGSTTEITCRR